MSGSGYPWVGERCALQYQVMLGLGYTGTAMLSQAMYEYTNNASLQGGGTGGGTGGGAVDAIQNTGAALVDVPSKSQGPVIQSCLPTVVRLQATVARPTAGQVNPGTPVLLLATALRQMLQLGGVET